MHIFSNSFEAFLLLQINLYSARNAFFPPLRRLIGGGHRQWTVEEKDGIKFIIFYEAPTSLWYASTFPFATFNCDLELFGVEIPIVARGEATEAKCFVSL